MQELRNILVNNIGSLNLNSSGNLKKIKQYSEQISIYEHLSSSHVFLSLPCPVSWGAVEYTDYTSAEG